VINHIFQSFFIFHTRRILKNLDMYCVYLHMYMFVL